MKNLSNLSGVILDIDQERMMEWTLPLVQVSRSVNYMGETVETRLDTYGEVMLMGDFHIGHKSHSVNPFNAHIKFLKEHPYIMIGLMGDYIEYASQTKYIKDEVMNVDDQIDLFVRNFKQFADRIMFILWGNHEERHAQYTNSKRLMKGIANEIGVGEKTYIGEPQRGIYLSLHAGNRRYGVYALHSKTGAIVNKTIQLRRAGSQHIASLIAQGHTHHLGFEQRTVKDMELVDNVPSMITRRQWLVSTGCFLKDASYAETRSYPLTVVGAPLIRFYSTKNKIDFTDLTLDYRDYVSKGGIEFQGGKVGVENWSEIATEDIFGVHKKCLT